MRCTRYTVLSGKGGSNKTFVQAMTAAEASRHAIPTLIIDLDPERNMSNRFKVPQHSTGMGSVLVDAGVTSGEADPDRGAKRINEEILGTPWEHVDLVPAGSDLQGVGQIQIEGTWLLRDIIDRAGLAERYQLIGIDTGGRRGSLTTLAMYASDVAYATIGPDESHLRKAAEAKARVDSIERAHPLRWAGYVLSNFDVRSGIHEGVRVAAYKKFGDEIRADIPARAALNEAWHVLERIGDRRDVAAAGLANIFWGFLTRDLMGVPADGVPATGVLR